MFLRSMAHRAQVSFHSWRACVLRTAASIVLIFFSQAQAGLGEPASSVLDDQASFKSSSLNVTAQGKLDLYEFTTADGIRIREYVCVDGIVCAVAWQGHDNPDLSLLLADFYKDYQRAAEKPRLNRRALMVSNERWVLHINALPRGFIGRAYLPGALLNDVSAHELR